MSDTILFERLDELVDDCSGVCGDWDNVLRRVENAARPAAPVRRLRRPSKRVLAWAVVVASLFVILFATPAFGLLKNWIGRKDVSYKNSKPAPFVVKRDFADLAIGAPERWDPQAIASQSRKVIAFKVGGRESVLFVAPTRKGGICWSFSRGANCMNSRPTAKMYASDPNRSREQKPWLLNVSGAYAFGPLDKRDQGNEKAYVYYMPSLSGVVLASNTADLRATFEDGSSAQIPFVWVSKPIDAGFFQYGVPSGHLKVGSRPVSLSALDSKGKLIARWAFSWKWVEQQSRFAEHAAAAGKANHRTSPPPPPPPLPKLKPPLQQGETKGVKVVAGANGAVVIDVSRASAPVRTLIANGVDWDCFAFFGPYHLSDPAGIGTGLPNGVEKSGLRMLGIPAPFDGCEISGMYGRRWPDRFHSHEAVEIAFTARARTHFADRAAARDLALFVQLLRIKGIRGLSGDALDSAISSEFGTVAHLDSSASPLAAGDVGYADRHGGATFVELSTTGRRFSITVENGRIVAENVRPLTILN